MDGGTTVYRDAVEFIDAGNRSFTELADHCLYHSLLEEADDAISDPKRPSSTSWTHQASSGSPRRSNKVFRIDEFVDGLVLTHRLTPEELQSELVEATPDLIAVILHAVRLSYPVFEPGSGSRVGDIQDRSERSPTARLFRTSERVVAAARELLDS